MTRDRRVRPRRASITPHSVEWTPSVRCAVLAQRWAGGRRALFITLKSPREPSSILLPCCRLLRREHSGRLHDECRGCCRWLVGLCYGSALASPDIVP